MSEQEQAQTEEKGGGLATAVGGVAGGVGAAIGADYLVANSAIKKHLAGVKGDEKVNEKAAKVVEEAFAKDAKAIEEAAKPVAEGAKAAKDGKHLYAKNKVLNDLKSIDPEKVNKIYFREAEDKSFVAYVKTELNPNGVLIKNIKKLPEGAEAGKDLEITAENAEKLVKGEKSFLKTVLASEEKGLVGAIRKTAGIGAGFKATSTLGKAGIIAGVIAGVGVGAKVVNSVFGGKHTDAAIADRTAPTQDQGTVRA